MTDEEVAKLSRYEIQEVGDRRLNGHLVAHAVLRRKANGVLEEFMPNVGSYENAKFIVKALKARDDENRKASEQRDREFQEGLKKPHVFLLARGALCYCGKPTGDPIHIADTDDDQI